MDPGLAALIPVPGPGCGDHPDVLGWACPVPFFGHLETARLATVGINPSDREFAAVDGTELTGPARRFPTLSSLALRAWPDLDQDARQEIASACCGYFDHNPYRGWFGQLQQLIAPAGVSYYAPGSGACHLDIVPWATSRKWGLLPATSKAGILYQSQQATARVIAYSPLVMVVLNGREVIRQFEALTGKHLEPARMPVWDLARSSGHAVPGMAYRGTVTQVAGVALGRQVLAAGYNHNLQSSFGVSAAVRAAISDWLAGQYRTACEATHDPDYASPPTCTWRPSPTCR
jgi:hypothetical protein